MRLSKPLPTGAFALFFLLIPHAFPAPAAAASHRVPGEFDTVHEAIGAAGEGDTVLVAEGTYREIVHCRKSVVLLGGWSADFGRRDPARHPTVIEAGARDASVFHFSGEGLTVVLDGFTVRGAWCDSGNGGAVLVNGRISAEIRSCRFLHNYARFHGGAVCFFRGARGVVEENYFEGNSAIFHGGGVALLDGAAVEVRRNVFRGNFVLYDSGGGVAALKGSELVVRANRFEENDARMRGGAVSLLHDVRGVVEGNLIARNRCGYEGGAVFSWKSSLACAGNTLVRNYSSRSGGIYVENGGDARVGANLIVRSPGPWLLVEGEVGLEVGENLVWRCGEAEGAEIGTPPLRVDPLLCDEVDDPRPRNGSPCLEGDPIGCYRSTCGEPAGAGEPPSPGTSAP